MHEWDSPDLREAVAEFVRMEILSELVGGGRPPRIDYKLTGRTRIRIIEEHPEVALA